MLEIRPLGLDGVLEIVPKRFGDARGFFIETYNAERFAEAGIDLRFVQDNHSYSAAAGVVRGLHYQLAAARAGQAGARRQRRDPRRGGRYPPQLDDLRQMGGARDIGRKGQPDPGAEGFRARLRHARAGHRGPVQGHRHLFAGARPVDPFRRSRDRHRLAVAGRRASSFRTRTSRRRCLPMPRCSHDGASEASAMNFLVTGGAGFIGSAVCRHLCANPAYRVDQSSTS